MNTNQDIHIVKCGVRSPIGTTATMSADMAQIGISRIMRHPYIIDEDGEPVLAGIASYIEEWIEDMERFEELLVPAINEAINPLKTLNENLRTIPILIGLPQNRPGLPKNFPEEIRSIIDEELKEYSHKFSVKTIEKGHSSGLIALEEACQKIKDEEADFCLIGGVESFHDPESFEWLEDNNRLLCTGNDFGFIPGESAGFCLITSKQIAENYQLPTLAKILAVATEQEKNLIGMDTVCTGEALTKVMDRVLKQLPTGQKIDRVFCDLNGERYRTDEYGFAGLRLTEYFMDFTNFRSPVNCWGDIGAATAPLLINLAIQSGRNQCKKTTPDMIWTSSDSGERSAALLELTANQENQKCQL